MRHRTGGWDEHGMRVCRVHVGTLIPNTVQDDSARHVHLNKGNSTYTFRSNSYCRTNQVFKLGCRVTPYTRHIREHPAKDNSALHQWLFELIPMPEERFRHSVPICYWCFAFCDGVLLERPKHGRLLISFKRLLFMFGDVSYS